MAVCETRCDVMKIYSWRWRKVAVGGCVCERERTGVSDMSGNEVKIGIILSFFFSYHI